MWTPNAQEKMRIRWQGVAELGIWYMVCVDIDMVISPVFRGLGTVGCEVQGTKMETRWVVDYKPRRAGS